VNMGRAKIVVVGSLVFDLVAWAERRPQKGESLLGTDFGMFPGGKGANQAVQAAKLGAEVFMCGRVGEDFFGESLIANLKKEKVDITFVIKDKETTTAVGCIVIDKEGDNSIVMVPQANMRCKTEDVDRVKKIIAQSDLLLLQLEIPLLVDIYAARIAKQEGVKVILNPAPARDIPDELISLSDIITPSEIETQILTGVKADNMDNIKKGAISLIKRGAKVVIVTLGEKGALMVTESKDLHFPAYKVSAVDTTGAGDAFNGALSVAIAEGRELEEAIKLANAAGALSVTKRGAQPSLPQREEVEELNRGQRPFLTE